MHVDLMLNRMQSFTEQQMNWRIFTIVKDTIWKFATGNRN